MTPLPTGTVTFLRTDVEGSMGLVRALGTDWDATNATHLGLLRDAVEDHHGVCVRTEGDALFAAFPEAGAAVRAAIAGQRAMDTRPWPDGGQVRVRMGLHTGEAHLAGDDYGGFDVNRAARVAAVGHGGQIILSGTTHALVESDIGTEFSVRDLGRHVLRDIPVPEHLFQVDVPGRRTEFPPLRIAGTVVGDLPARLTSFVGREDDLDELRGLLAANRLVTLTGPGGIGKTSLATELARGQAGATVDGAWFVALDALADADQVMPAIARTLGLFDGVERPAADALPRFLAARSLLLVLDNFEHVIDAADQVESLLRVSPGSRFIVTSRAPLHVAGEQEYPVRPLPIGEGAGAADGSSDVAARLFVERARAVRPGWEPGTDASVVSEICALLDGLPLGIELAAARVSLLPVRIIRDRLATHLPLPGPGLRSAPARQRTLEAAIEWSHDLLSPEDQRTLQDLGVFEGSFDAEQAAQVLQPSGPGAGGADVIDRLVVLAEQSLISRDLASIDDAGKVAAGGVRFTMLRTVQGFADRCRTRDGRDHEVRQRHAKAFADLAESAAPHLNTGHQPPWLDRLAADDANLHAALRWSVTSGEVELALGLLGALWRYWLINGRLAEGAGWVDRILSMPGAETPSQARLWALAAAGGIAYWRADPQASLRLYEEQLDVATLVGDAQGIADADYNLASARFIDGDLSGAMGLIQEARRRYVDLGDDVRVNRMAWAIGTATMSAEGPQRAMPVFERVLVTARALDDTPYVALAAGSVAWASYALGDIATANARAIEAIVCQYSIRDVASCAVALPIAAVVALGYGHPADAARLMGAFDGLCERYGVSPPLALASLISGADPAKDARDALGPEAFAAAFEAGRRMTVDQAVDLVAGLGVAEPA